MHSQVIHVPPTGEINTEERKKYYNAGQSTPCTRYPKRTESVALYKCIFLMFQTSHNISLTGGLSTNVMITHAPITKNNVEALIKYFKTQPLHHVIDVNSYAYLLVVDKQNLHSQMKLKSMLKPLAWWVWIVMIITSISFTVTYIFEGKNFSWGKMRSEMFNLWLRLCVIVLDKSVKIPCEGNSRQLLLLSAWCFFCLILSENYKAFLITNLSFTEIPTSPENLEGLLSRGVPIGTTATLQGGDRIFPEFMDIVLDEMIPKIASDKTVQAFKDLRTSVTWFTAETDDFVFNVLQRGKVKAQIADDEVSLSGTFALIDPLYKIYEFQKFFGAVGTKLVTKPVLEHVFVSKAFWFCSHNYILKIFISFISKLYETGQYYRWRQYDKDEMIKERTLNLLEKVKHESITTVIGTNNEQNIPKGAFLNILIHYQIFIGLCILSFGFENLFKCRPKG